VWNLLVMGTSFQAWPDGDPEGLRQLGEAWGELADELTSAFGDLEQSASRVSSVWGGDAGAAFAHRWSDFAGEPENRRDIDGAHSSAGVQILSSLLFR
jgi:hypothetical protein